MFSLLNVVIIKYFCAYCAVMTNNNEAKIIITSEITAFSRHFTRSS